MNRGSVKQGPGPPWLRKCLVVIALLYYAALFKPVPDGRWTRPIAFFTQASCLFPNAAAYKIGYRLGAWSCGERRWVPLDVRAYFPIRAEDKESRFHRLAHFYKYNRTVIRALDEFVSERHAGGAADGVDGPIGGIRLVQTVQPIPPPDSTVERFLFETLAPIPEVGIRERYTTPGRQRKTRCEALR